MDEMERIYCPVRARTAGRAAGAWPSTALSASRALRGEVSESLRAVRDAYDAKAIRLIRYFARDVSEDDGESMQLDGGSVAADFPDRRVFEHGIAFQRKEHSVGRHA